MHDVQVSGVVWHVAQEVLQAVQICVVGYG